MCVNFYFLNFCSFGKPVKMVATLLLVFVTTASPTTAGLGTVFTANTASGLSLQVYSDDSYTLGTSPNSTWLSSSQSILGFHSADVWYVAKVPPPPPPGGPCADRLANTDCRGNDISYIDSNDPTEVRNCVWGGLRTHKYIYHHPTFFWVFSFFLKTYVYLH